MSYDAPTVLDFGTIVEVTQATAIIGNEDGASKIGTSNHHEVTIPSAVTMP